jgi:hypothetical protein
MIDFLVDTLINIDSGTNVNTVIGAHNHLRGVKPAKVDVNVVRWVARAGYNK